MSIKNFTFNVILSTIYLRNFCIQLIFQHFSLRIFYFFIYESFNGIINNRFSVNNRKSCITETFNFIKLYSISLFIPFAINSYRRLEFLRISLALTLVKVQFYSYGESTITHLCVVQYDKLTRGYSARG